MTKDELRQEFEGMVLDKFKAPLFLERDHEGDYAMHEIQVGWYWFQRAFRNIKRKEQPCPYVVSSSEGTSYCALAEAKPHDVITITKDVKLDVIAQHKALLRECYSAIYSALTYSGEATKKLKAVESKLKKEGYGNE